MTSRSWVDDSPVPGFSIHVLPYGVFRPRGGDPRVGVGIADRILDLAAALGGDDFATGSLNAFMARGPEVWRSVRQQVTELLSDPVHAETVRPSLHRVAEVDLLLPFEVADYVDFYCSLEHASNLGSILRPGGDPLQPNWRYLPVGYHGRAGTVVVSGTPVGRPWGQRSGQAGPVVGPSTRLDIEAEIGFVVGVGSQQGEQVPLERFADHVFGIVLVNDWSARDLQAWEYVPLGPFLGKSFATSISPWVVPLVALETARRPGPAQNPAPFDHLRRVEPWGLEMTMEVALNGMVVSRPPVGGLYWTADQMLAHLTSNGAHLRTGDLFASGTISGPSPAEVGSLIELSLNGERPFELADGSTRTFLEDGDEVVISATIPGPEGEALHVGHVTGVVAAAKTDMKTDIPWSNSGRSEPSRSSAGDPGHRLVEPPGRGVPDDPGVALVSGSDVETAIERAKAALDRIERAFERMSDGARTGADGGTGETWDRHQVLGHVAELIPYWTTEIQRVVDHGEGLAFGRVKSTPSRLERIEERRRHPVEERLVEARSSLSGLSVYLRTLMPDSFLRRGHHQTKGEMSVTQILEEFVVGHLEEHAGQLEACADDRVHQDRSK